jgi:hemerythrin
MPAVVWNNDLCVGIEQVDNEHQNLVCVLNQLDDAMKKGKGTRVMSEILIQLVQYTKVHFENEEKLMADVEYPKLERHKSQHRQLIEKVEAFYQKFNSQGKRITKEMMDFLKYWLSNHILVDDMAFGKFCVAQPA